MNLLNSLVLIFVINQAYGQEWVSPCPSLFRYDPAGPQGDSWKGTITLRTDQDLSGIWLRMVLDRPPIEISTTFGEAVQRESTEYLIRNPDKGLKIGETEDIDITVRFNAEDPAPRLIGFRLNARVVCPENGIINKGGSDAAPPPPPVIPPSNVFPSPCPDVFEYEPLNDNDKWFGIVKVKSDTPLTGVWIRIVLDRESLQLGVSDENWFGEVSTRNNKEYVIKNEKIRVSPGSEIPVRFFIKFKPGTTIPKVLEIKLNQKSICKVNVVFLPAGGNGQGIPGPITGFPGFPGPGARPAYEVECGTIAAQPSPFITFGERTKEGEWPWHAALYRAKGAETKYICGGSLISHNHILTVAHCVTRVYTNTPISLDSLVIYLGKYFLTKYNPGIQYFQADKILVHNDYDHRIYKNDIAVVKLNHPAEYTDRVRPICLWSDEGDLRTVLNRDGTVVGWGFDQTGIVTESLFKTNMPIVDAQTCIYSYPEFFGRFTNEKTFCAGYRNYSSVCNGDSGGGMVFPKEGKPNQWQLRGLVSIGVALQAQAICDTKHFAVFTDVAKYLDWIYNAMTK